MLERLSVSDSSPYRTDNLFSGVNQQERLRLYVGESSQIIR